MLGLPCDGVATHPGGGVMENVVLLTYSLQESIMETCSVVLTFESVDEILWCDHSNETLKAVLLHGTICFSIFYKIDFGILFEFCFLVLLGVKGFNGLTLWLNP